MTAIAKKSCRQDERDSLQSLIRPTGGAALRRRRGRRGLVTWASLSGVGHASAAIRQDPPKALRTPQRRTEPLNNSFRL